MTSLLPLLALLLLLIAALVYFAPALVAYQRGHENITAIFVLNVLLGWTFVGWVIALVWAFTNNNRRTIYADRSGRRTGWE